MRLSEPLQLKCPEGSPEREDMTGHFQGRSTSNGSHLERSKANDRGRWKI